MAATPTYRSSKIHGYRRSPSEHVFLLRDRHADRLRAGAGVAGRRALDRSARRRCHAAIRQRRRQGLDADDSVFRAGRRDHGRGRYGKTPGRFCRGACRVYPHKGRTFAGQHYRDHDHERHLGIVGGRYLRDRFGDDPPDGCERLSAGVRNQRHHQRLASGHCHSAEPQLRDLFAGDRWRGVDHQPVSRRPDSGLASRLLADAALPVLRLPRQAPQG